MSDSFKSAVGRRVVSRSTAEDLGPVDRLVVAVDAGRAVAVVVGKGRKARILDWADIVGFGPDAVIVTDDGAVREPGPDGALAHPDLIRQRVLSELGNQLGMVEDVEFDPATGELEALLVGDRRLAPSTLLSVGSYAVVVDQTTDPG